MRYIKKQADIEITNVLGEAMRDEKGEPVRAKFRDFVLSRLVDPALAKDMAAVMSAFQMRGVVMSSIESEAHYALESSDWERLRDATHSPTGGYLPQVAMCLVPFMRAIVEAQEKFSG